MSELPSLLSFQKLMDLSGLYNNNLNSKQISLGLKPFPPAESAHSSLSNALALAFIKETSTIGMWPSQNRAPPPSPGPEQEGMDRGRGQRNTSFPFLLISSFFPTRKVRPQVRGRPGCREPLGKQHWGLVLVCGGRVGVLAIPHSSQAVRGRQAAKMKGAIPGSHITLHHSIHTISLV